MGTKYVITTVTFQEVLDEFARLHPEYATQEGAKDCCVRASDGFISLLIARGFLEEKCPRWEWEVMEVDVVAGVSHYAARVGCVLVDWTARQFDPAAPWPKVTTDPVAWILTQKKEEGPWCPGGAAPAATPVSPP